MNGKKHKHHENKHWDVFKGLFEHWCPCYLLSRDLGLMTLFYLFLIPSLVSYHQIDGFWLVEATRRRRGQLKDILIKHFGKPLSDLELLELILLHVPRILIHIVWLIKTYLDHLKIIPNFPAQCAKAYEQLIRQAREEIGGNFKALRKAVCVGIQKPLPPA